VSKSFLAQSAGFEWQMTVTAVSASPAFAALTPGTNWIANGAATTTLEAGSFVIDTASTSMQWRVQVTAPISCAGVSGSQLTVDLAYSFVPFG
jgi:hypothetical protein